MAGEQERFESMDADDTAASEPCLDEQIGATCSFTEIKSKPFLLLVYWFLFLSLLRLRFSNILS